MLKLKTRKTAYKRYKKTSSGKFVYKHAFKGHLLMNKSKKQKARLSINNTVKKVDLKNLNFMLPY
jgi:large subunit ribosomal protein L35